MPGLNNSEPNNMKAPELCTVANYTTTAGTPSVWGWADANCLGRYASICKILRKQLAFHMHLAAGHRLGGRQTLHLGMHAVPACLAAGSLPLPLSTYKSAPG